MHSQSSDTAAKNTSIAFPHGTIYSGNALENLYSYPFIFTFVCRSNDNTNSGWFCGNVHVCRWNMNVLGLLGAGREEDVRFLFWETFEE